MNHSNLRLHISDVTAADIPTVHRLSLEAFADDKHTLMKMHEKGTDASSEMMSLDGLYGYLNHPRVIMKKAVDQDKIVGYTAWAKWNFNDEHPGDGNLVTNLEAEVHHPDYPVDPSLPLIKQLENKTTGHLTGMQERLNLPGRKCLYCVGIQVLPSYQSRGVGTALLSWVPELADQSRATCWVHLSDAPGGWRMFEKMGFRMVNANVVDLDAYKTKDEDSIGNQIKWGTYTFRCMVREPLQHA